MRFVTLNDSNDTHEFSLQLQLQQLDCEAVVVATVAWPPLWRNICFIDNLILYFIAQHYLLQLNRPMFCNAQQTVKLLLTLSVITLTLLSITKADVQGKNEVQAANSNRYFLLFISSIKQKLIHRNNLTALQNVL